MVGRGFQLAPPTVHSVPHMLPTSPLSSSPQELLEPHGYRHLVRIGVDEVFRRHPPCDGGRGREREREPRSRGNRHRRSQ